MVSEQTIPKRRFPVTAFVIIFFITLVLFTGLGWGSLHSYKDIKTIQERDLRLQKLVGIIIHLDEVLTMSARMGAETGNMQWEERYLSFEPQLDSAINEAKRLVPETFMGEAASQTNTANIKLVTMEKQAFELVRQEQREAASALLYSEEYEEQKQLYSEGMGQITTSMQSYVKDLLKEHRYHAYITFIVIAITLPSLIFAWIYVIRRMGMYVATRRVAEDRLKDSFEQTRSWLDNSPVCTKVVDLDFNLKYMSAAGIKALKVKDVTKLYGKPYPFDFFPESFKDSMTKNLERVKRTGEVITEEAPISDIEGNELWFQATIVPVRDSEGRIEFFIIVSVDINERKKMEEALIQSEKLKSIGTITSGVAHEFNNILTIISGNVHILEDKYKDHDELIARLSTVRQATVDGAQISRRMLRFTKIGVDGKEIIPYDITDLIKQSIEFTMPKWKSMAQSNGIDYHMDTDGITKIPPILCDPTGIREVFINIINNALDAMPEGGSISFSTWSNESTVFVRISDTGQGMTEDVRKNVFDPFFTTKRPAGTGLGMSIAYSAVKNHGGKIEVESEVGRGSIFTIQLPVTSGTVSPIMTPVPEQEIKSGNLGILVVDDEEDICEVLDSLLSKQGHKVLTVNNGAEAIELAKREAFDLVLCDLAMPDVFGYDVIKALHGLERTPKIGIITGCSEKLKHVEEGEIMVDFVLRKPFNYSELSEHINDVISAK